MTTKPVAHPPATDLASAETLRAAILAALRAHAANTSAHNRRAAIGATPLSAGGPCDVAIELERHMFDARVHAPAYGPSNPRPRHLAFSQSPAGATEAQIVEHANRLREVFNAHARQCGSPMVDAITARRAAADQAERDQILDGYARQGWEQIAEYEKLRDTDPAAAARFEATHRTQMHFARHRFPKEAA